MERNSGPLHNESGEAEAMLSKTFEVAKSRLGNLLLSKNDAKDFSKAFSMELVEEGAGNIVPVATYDSRQRIKMRTEMQAMNDFAELITDESELPYGEAVKILIGAGVARCAIGWRLLPKSFETHRSPINGVYEKLYDRTALWEMSDSFDDDQGSTLRQTVERMGDGNIAHINILRFATGVSLTYMLNNLDMQKVWQFRMRSLLADTLILRSRHMNLAFSLLGNADDAFKWFDDTSPDEYIAMAFPMSPGEVIESFATD